MEVQAIPPRTPGRPHPVRWTSLCGGLVLSLVISLLAGCYRKEREPSAPLVIKSQRPAEQSSEPGLAPPAAAPPPAPPGQPAVGAEAPTANPSTPAADTTAQAEPGVADLNAALQAWTFRHNSPPKDFSDLIKAGLLKKVPVPPAGRKYVLHPLTMNVTLE